MTDKKPNVPVIHSPINEISKKAEDDFKKEFEKKKLDILKEIEELKFEWMIQVLLCNKIKPIENETMFFRGKKEGRWVQAIDEIRFIEIRDRFPDIRSLINAFENKKESYLQILKDNWKDTKIDFLKKLSNNVNLDPKTNLELRELVIRDCNNYRNNVSNHVVDVRDYIEGLQNKINRGELKSLDTVHLEKGVAVVKVDVPPKPTPKAEPPRPQ